MLTEEIPMLPIRPREIEVPPDDPFKNDALDRKRLEPPLTEFLSQASGSFVLALDGSWGSGKTTFIRMWRAKLASNGHFCLCFNAWETDFVEDPLVALVGELSDAIRKLVNGKETAKLRAHLRKTKKVATSVLKHSIPVAVRLATAGILDLSEFVEKELSDLTAEIASDQIENYIASKNELSRFRSELEKLVNHVSEIHGGPGKKVVVFVDELDRCRPTYAIELLERIKHLFDVPGIMFVLGIDRPQLSHSINAVYGAEFDASGYLRRFIDYDYKLPDPPPRAFLQASLQPVWNRSAQPEPGRTDAGYPLGPLRWCPLQSSPANSNDLASPYCPADGAQKP